MSTATTSRPRSTSTAGLRAGPLDLQAYVIPPERRHLITAPCDLCDAVETVQFDDGLCTPCRDVQLQAAQDDREQDRLRRAVRMLEELDARGGTL